ncbi:uncharacterized protein Bfra_009442 [Botrytis fragariae]|uniref:Uncharacterized protein n=1 Tax=Botrytis fragariae TaxID=1964551 RepID=A0A8H6EG02_9HELO|nr:uncharacterized protein Bfra_009442 [Botrytis fragariae]KAF5870887.1 hypothetical protein Bfra_009442 [Botrytis fragariae]
MTIPIHHSRTILPYCTCSQCWSAPEKKDLWISCNYGRTIWFSRATPMLTCSSLIFEIACLCTLAFGFAWILGPIAVLKG